MSFVPAVGPADEEIAGWWYCFQRAHLLVREDGSGESAVPRTPGVSALGLRPDTVQLLGTHDGIPCLAAGLDAAPAALPPGYRFVHLRELFGVLPDEQFAIATRAAHLAQWDLAHRFCGRCGKPLALKSDERARVCLACGQLYYPQISPAVIVAVCRGDQILLARSPRFPPGVYSVLAGFVEAGETVEACVHREIREEVGIEVDHLRYIGSQPWPYPNSLMLGFMAEHAAGEIRVDGVEILEASWFTPDALPGLPGPGSFARVLLDHYLRRVGASPEGRSAAHEGRRPSCR
ncbi:MAG TPA: NAD(+) diphosphatase [Armatimonadota bacterium]|nr:NAD(+) diphosphatase [Armatimonadota bacterium]HPT99443.1 NAD(+) diphosphatase [Armatimonadota bacterium]